MINIAETTQNDKFMKFVGKNQTVFVIYIKNTIILKAAVVFFPVFLKEIFTCWLISYLYVVNSKYFFSALFFIFFYFFFFWCKLLNNTERPLPTKALKQVTKRVFFFFFNYLPKFATIYFLLHFFKQHIL